MPVTLTLLSRTSRKESAGKTSMRKPQPTSRVGGGSWEPMTQTVPSLGLDLAPLTLNGALDKIGEALCDGRQGQVITANLNYAMISRTDPDLARVNERALMVLADGMPLVWDSKRGNKGVPERVAGSDLIPALCERAQKCGWKLFFLGGAEGVGQAARERMYRLYPGLEIVGVSSARIGSDGMVPESLAREIAESRPDILIAALGQPKGEKWLDKNLESLGVPLGIQVGATLDFMAGRVSRAPLWIQRSGIEWIWRFAMEPTRLGGRYAQNLLFFVKYWWKTPHKRGA